MDNTITEDELAVRDFAAYLARLKAGKGEFVKVKRALMIHLIEEKLEDAESTAASPSFERPQGGQLMAIKAHPTLQNE